MIKIDKGVPLPRNINKYPWKELGIGDSFFVPGSDNVSNSMGAGMWTACKRIGIKCISRTVTEDGVKGIRVWRVE